MIMFNLDFSWGALLIILTIDFILFLRRLFCLTALHQEASSFMKQNIWILIIELQLVF